MPGRFFLNESLVDLADALEADCSLEDPGPRADVAPGETVAVLVDAPRRLTEMRWNMILGGRVNARGRPVMETITNARSETLFTKSAYQDVRRGILPVSGWYEWTGKRGSKARWHMSPARDDRFLFATIWDIWAGPGGLELRQMAAVTVEPNEDVAEYHHRMPAILADDAVTSWLGGPEEQASALLASAPPGTIRVEPA